MNALHIVSFTGHRHLTQAQHDTAHAAVLTFLFQRQQEYADQLRVVSGMADGVDQLVAQICCTLNIPWCAAIPHPAYPEVYGLSGVKWDWLLDHAKTIVYVYEEQAWTPKMNFGRNVKMVEWATEVVAVTYWSPDDISPTRRPRGGTAHAIQTAQKAGRPLRFLTLPR